MSNVSWYVDPNRMLTFKQTANTGSIQAEVNGTKESVSVEWTDFQFLCSGALSTAEKIRRAVRNCHIRPVLKQTPKCIQFEPIRAEKEWNEVQTCIIKELWIPRRDGTLSYVAGNTVMTWDWRSNSCIPQRYKTTKITALAELEDGTLVVGDSGGMLHVKAQIIPTNDPTQKPQSIKKVIPLSSDSLMVVMEEDSVYSSKKTFHAKIFDLTTNVFTELKLENFTQKIILGDGTVLELKEGHLTSYRSGKSNPCDVKDVDKIFPLSNASTKVLIVNKGRMKGKIWDVNTDLKKDIVLTPISNKIFDNTIFILLDENTLLLNDLMSKSAVITVYDLTHQTLKPIEHPDFSSVTNMILLSDGTIMCASSEKPSGIFIKKLEGEDVWNGQYPLLNKSDLIELVDGSVAFLRGEVLVVLSPKFTQSQWVKKETSWRQSSVTEEIEKHPHDLNLYKPYVEQYSASGEHRYGPLLSGLVASLRGADYYKARRFYEKARQFKSDNGLASRIIHCYLQYLPDNPLRRQVSLDMFRITKDESLIKKEASTKKRLLIGEGNFTYTEVVTKKNRETHPKLPQSITATEREVTTDNDTLQRIARLTVEGVLVLSGIDAIKLHEHFQGQRFERIQWNCPFGNGGNRDEFREIIPKFFLSASKLQIVGDRIHVTLGTLPIRQLENPIVFGSTQAGYRLIRKRAFGSTRYDGYQHVKTLTRTRNTYDSYTEGGMEEEYVFEKTDIPLEAPTLEFAKKLQDPNKKRYEIEQGSTNYDSDLKKYRFDCSTDGDSSDYYE